DLPADRNRAQAELVRAGERLIGEISRAYAIGDHELVVGATVGAALWSGDGADDAALVRQADMALYWAKAAGRGVVRVYAAHMQQNADERLRLERGLRLARDRGEFELRFEPQLDARDRVVGAEALLRWRPASGRYVPPARFIAVAEETGLIHPLGDYVLDNACARIKAWQQMGVALPPRFAVNVSPWQLASGDFVRKVKRALSTAALD